MMLTKKLLKNQIEKKKQNSETWTKSLHQMKHKGTILA